MTVAPADVKKIKVVVVEVAPSLLKVGPRLIEEFCKLTVVATGFEGSKRFPELDVCLMKMLPATKAISKLVVKGTIPGLPALNRDPFFLLN